MSILNSDSDSDTSSNPPPQRSSIGSTGTAPYRLLPQYRDRDSSGSGDSFASLRKRVAANKQQLVGGKGNPNLWSDFARSSRVRNLGYGGGVGDDDSNEGERGRDEEEGEDGLNVEDDRVMEEEKEGDDVGMEKQGDEEEGDDGEEEEEGHSFSFSHDDERNDDEEELEQQLLLQQVVALQSHLMALGALSSGRAGPDSGASRLLSEINSLVSDTANIITTGLLPSICGNPVALLNQTRSLALNGAKEIVNEAKGGERAARLQTRSQVSLSFVTCF